MVTNALGNGVTGKEKLIGRVKEIIERVYKNNTEFQKVPELRMSGYMEKMRSFYDVSERSSFDTESYFFEMGATFASEELDVGLPIWEFIAGALYIEYAKYELSELRSAFGYEYSFYELHKFFSENGIDATEQGTSVFSNYSKEEIEEAATWIDESLDYKQKYTSAHTSIDVYSEKFESYKFLSLPQERYLTIALFISQNVEKVERMKTAKDMYWHLSNKTISPATPIMSNSNLRDHQLSSCFIDTTADNLEDIYGSNKDLAKVSKFGGGIGVYMGKVRSENSWIRNIKGASSGVLPWINKLSLLQREL